MEQHRQATTLVVNKAIKTSLACRPTPFLPFLVIDNQITKYWMLVSS